MGLPRILSLHFNYAVLFTASPVFLASASVWGDMVQAPDGYKQLERGRDAAFSVIQSICSVRRWPSPVDLPTDVCSRLRLAELSLCRSSL